MADKDFARRAAQAYLDRMPQEQLERVVLSHLIALGETWDLFPGAASFKELPDPLGSFLTRQAAIEVELKRKD